MAGSSSFAGSRVRVRKGPLRPVARTGAALLLALAVLGAACAAEPPAPGKLKVQYGLIAAADGLDPNVAPAGANDPKCRSRNHPRPVILVHGTFANQALNWASLSPLLKNDGYCVFTFNYGGSGLGGLVRGLGDIRTSAAELSRFVDKVRSQTGARKVDLVGHSQGGLMPRYYLNFLDGRTKVRNLVALAPSSHGTTFMGLVTLGRSFGYSSLIDTLLAPLCMACVQQQAGSEFMKQMASVPDTVPGVRYTVIATRYDEFVTPYESQFLDGPKVVNITIQDGCEVNNDGHAGIAFDRRALHEVLNALDPATASPAPCTPVAFDFGG